MPRPKDPLSPKSLADNVGKNSSYWRRMKEKKEFTALLYLALKQILNINIKSK